jgi:hypothetical protein
MIPCSSDNFGGSATFSIVGLVSLSFGVISVGVVGVDVAGEE